jgi:hypothetical protein
MLYDKIKRGEYDFPEEGWKHISADAKDLVKNSNDRYKASEIMDHPWIKSDITQDVKVSCDKIKAYNVIRKMRRAKNAVGFVHKLALLRKDKEKSPSKYQSPRKS